MTNFKETTEDMIGHIGEFHLRDEEKKRVA